jgi:hypothetical protein
MVVNLRIYQNLRPTFIRFLEMKRKTTDKTTYQLISDFSCIYCAPIIIPLIFAIEQEFPPPSDLLDFLKSQIQFYKYTKFEGYQNIPDEFFQNLL